MQMRREVRDAHALAPMDRNLNAFEAWVSRSGGVHDEFDRSRVGLLVHQAK